MVNVHEAKTHFSKLLAGLAKNGQTVVICRNGEPVANLVPHKPSQTSRNIKPHPRLSRIKIAYDPVETLAEDEWPGAER